MYLQITGVTRLRVPAHRHSLNNQCELRVRVSSQVTTVAARLWRMPISTEEETGDLFGIRCPALCRARVTESDREGQPNTTFRPVAEPEVVRAWPSEMCRRPAVQLTRM